MVNCPRHPSPSDAPATFRSAQQRSGMGVLASSSARRAALISFASGHSSSAQKMVGQQAALESQPGIHARHFTRPATWTCLLGHAQQLPSPPHAIAHPQAWLPAQPLRAAPAPAVPAALPPTGWHRPAAPVPAAPSTANHQPLASQTSKSAQRAGAQAVKQVVQHTAVCNWNRPATLQCCKRTSATGLPLPSTADSRAAGACSESFGAAAAAACTQM